MMTSAFDGLGLDYLDLVLLNDPLGPECPPPPPAALRCLQKAAPCAAWASPAAATSIPRLLKSELVTALSSPFNLSSGWAERNRIRSRRHPGLGGDRRGLLAPGPARRRRQAAAAKPSLWRRRSDPLADVGGYDFLTGTQGWSAEDICLGYALTEPSLATVRITADTKRRGRAPGRRGRARPAQRRLRPDRNGPLFAQERERERAAGRP
jgi:hypothetical protein